jgi:hypothetical protein
MQFVYDNATRLQAPAFGNHVTSLRQPFLTCLCCLLTTFGVHGSSVTVESPVRDFAAKVMGMTRDGGCQLPGHFPGRWDVDTTSVIFPLSFNEIR